MKVRVFEGKDDLKGKVEVMLPSKLRLVRLAKSLSFKEVDGKVEASDDLEKVEKSIELVRDYIKSVNLEVEGKKISSWDELCDDSSCDELMEEIINWIFSGGGKLGEA